MLYFHRLCIMLLLIVCTVFTAAPSMANPPLPEKKWRIICVEGGGYTDYQQILAATARRMEKLGLIQNGNVPIPFGSDSTKPMWEWLALHAGGKRIEFVKDGYYSGNWDDAQRTANKKAILERIHNRKDVDMIFTFGTAAGLDMATDEHSVPTFCMSVTDAVQAGIIQSADDSGRDHVHAPIETGRYERQITVFHDVFKFKRLGIPYEDTPEGRAAVALPALEKAAAELGVELVRCTAPLYAELETSFTNLHQCLKQLSRTSDAIFLTTNSGMQWNRMAELLQPLINAGIPSFSQSGMDETRLGVLMSLAQHSFDSEGVCSAEAISAVMKGAKPREVSQHFTGPLGLAINLKMAMLVGWDPPFEVLAAVDKVFHNIRNADK